MCKIQIKSIPLMNDKINDRYYRERKVIGLIFHPKQVPSILKFYFM